MHFGNFRFYSVKIGNLKKVSDAFGKTPGAFRRRSSLLWLISIGHTSRRSWYFSERKNQQYQMSCFIIMIVDSCGQHEKKNCQKMADSRKNKENRKKTSFNLIFHYSHSFKKVPGMNTLDHSESPQVQIMKIFESSFFNKKYAILVGYHNLPNLILWR